MEEPTILQKAAILWLVFATGVTLLMTLIMVAGLIHAHPREALWVLIPGGLLLTVAAIIHLIRS